MTAMLKTDRLILRRPGPQDWEAFRDFGLSERGQTFGLGGLGNIWRMFAAELGHWEIHGYGMWAVTRPGESRALALVGPWTPADWPETEVGWIVLDPAVEGTGIATEAARAAITHAWDVLGWDTIVSYIDTTNDRSIRLAQKLGATLDPEAPQPRPGKHCHVYRHPRPVAAQPQVQS